MSLQPFFRLCAKLLGWSDKVHPGDQERYYFFHDKPVWGVEEWKPFTDWSSTKWFFRFLILRLMAEDVVRM